MKEEGAKGGAVEFESPYCLFEPPKKVDCTCCRLFGPRYAVGPNRLPRQDAFTMSYPHREKVRSCNSGKNEAQLTQDDVSVAVILLLKGI